MPSSPEIAGSEVTRAEHAEPSRADADTDLEPRFGASSDDGGQDHADLAEALGGAPAAPGNVAWWGWALTGLVVAASLVLPFSVSGIWDPYELNVAELARRLAVQLFGAADLALQGANNAPVTVGQLGRGELPFTSIALGFRLLGLHEWSGRLPLVLWGLGGVVALYFLLARLADRTTGLFGAMALATTPLYFLHSRTMLGDVVTMAACSLAVAGSALGVFAPPATGDPAESRQSWLWRMGALFVGGVGLLSGLLARGLLIGVAIPALGVGVTWVIVRTAGAKRCDRVGDGIAGALLVLGVGAASWGAKLVLERVGGAQPYSALLGFTVSTQGKLPTFDVMIGALGHSLFPWSAFVPLAMGRATSAPVGVVGAQAEGESVLRVLLLVVASLAFAIHAALVPMAGVLPFSAVFALAAVGAVCLRDLDRGAQPSAVVALSVVAFLVLFLVDFRNFPDKGLAAYGLDRARCPESFQVPAFRWLLAATTVAVALFFFSWLETSDRSAPRFVRSEYRAYPEQLRSLARGNVWFALWVLEAVLCALAAFTWYSQQFGHWSRFESMGSLGRKLAMAGWLALPALVFLLPLGGLFARDLFRALYARLPVSRAWGALFGLVASGLVLSLGYYPGLAAQLSPKGVFDSYLHAAGPGEPLGLLGISATSASYYAGGRVSMFDQASAAYEWLVSGPERRWLVFGQKDLAQLNSLYRGGGALPGVSSPLPRGKLTGRHNLPVVDARSSEILLGTSRLEPAQQSQNPLDAWVLDAPPPLSHPVDGDFGGQLVSLGWDVTRTDGRAVAALSPGERYQFRIALRVSAPIAGKWETFIHIDGHNRRFNGDHETLGGKYPFQYWHVDDVVLDVHPFTLEPSFVPGKYSVFYGLFAGGRRLEVKRGQHQDDRLAAGEVEVR